MSKNEDRTESIVIPWDKNKALDTFLINLPKHKRKDPLVRAEKQAALAPRGIAESAAQLVSAAPGRIRLYLEQILIISRGSALNAESLAPTPAGRLVNIPESMVHLTRELVTAMVLARPLIRAGFLRIRAGQPRLMLAHDEAIKQWGIVADEIASLIQLTPEVEAALRRVRVRVRSASPNPVGGLGLSFGVTGQPPAHVRPSVDLVAAGAVRFMIGHEIGHHALNHLAGKAQEPRWAAPGPELLQDWVEARAIPRTGGFTSPHQRELDADLFGYWLLMLAGRVFQQDQDAGSRESHLNESVSVGLLAFALTEQGSGVDLASKSHPSFTTRLEELSIVAAFGSEVASRVTPPIKSLGRRVDSHPRYAIGVSIIEMRVLGRLLALPRS